VFFMGDDIKSNIFQLIAMKVDTSLVLPKHSLSIVPHFDHSQHPSTFTIAFIPEKYFFLVATLYLSRANDIMIFLELQYPPRFLEAPDKRMLGKNYSMRLGMRLLPKTVFPSEFITVFYEENARLPKKFKKFALRPCQVIFINYNDNYFICSNGNKVTGITNVKGVVVWH